MNIKKRRKISCKLNTRNISSLDEEGVLKIPYKSSFWQTPSFWKSLSLGIEKKLDRWQPQRSQKCASSPLAGGETGQEWERCRVPNITHSVEGENKTYSLKNNLQRQVLRLEGENPCFLSSSKGKSIFIFLDHQRTGLFRRVKNWTAIHYIWKIRGNLVFVIVLSAGAIEKETTEI